MKKFIFFRRHSIAIRYALVILLALLHTCPSFAQTGKALDFDGIDNSVTLPVTISGSYTKEAWIKASSLTNFPNIITGNNTALFIDNGKLTAGHAGVFAYKEVQDAVDLVTGTWYHIAVTYDASISEMKLYKDAVLVATNSGASAYTENVLYLSLYLNANFFTGQMDEVRIWKTARTVAEITALKNCELNGDEPGLIAYYNFNQGVAGANNTGISLLTDTQDKCYATNGTLNNFTLNGSSSNFIAAGPVLSGSCGTNLPNINVTGNAVCILTGDVTPDAADHTSFGNFTTTPLTRIFNIQNTGTAALQINSVQITGLNAADFSVTFPPSASITAGSSSTFTVSFNPAGANGIKNAVVEINNNDADEALYTFAIGAVKSSQGQSLFFDGNNDDVSLPLIISGDYTKEAWIKTNILTGFPNILSGTGTALFLNEGKIAAGHQIGSFNQAVGATVLSTTQWYHVAVSYNASTQDMKLYLDGAVVATAAAVPAYTETILKVGSLNGYQFFWGKIDQVRIWKTVRTDAEILNNYHCNITGDEPGLLAWYNFNQAAGEGDNTGITTLINESDNCTVTSLNGTLNNFALTGATSNWATESNNITTTCAQAFPNIRILGNSICITKGDNSPAVSDNTDFGNAPLAGVSKTFIIQNTGTATLNIGTVIFSGVYAAVFSVTTAPAATLAPGASTSMIIKFTPSGSGPQTATVTINSSDPGEPAFNFDIRGTGATGPINISNINVTSNINGTATVTWNTDATGNSVVNYGSNPSTLSLNNTNAAMVTNHSILLTGLSLGENYYFRITSVDALSNSVTYPTPPAYPLVISMPANITVHPASQIICEGSTATFSSTAVSDTTLSVQWQLSYDNGLNWADSAGATNSILNFVVKGIDGSKRVRAVWTTPGGSINSNAATITVKDTTWSVANITICSSNLPYYYNNYILNAAGVYNVVLPSAGTNGCDSTIQLTLSVTPSTLSGTYNVQRITCFGGTDASITATGTGGTAPYEYSIDLGITWVSSGEFIGLSSGNYNIRIKDATGCIKETIIGITVEKAVWTGTVSSNWHTAGNWDTGVVPTATTHVLIPNSTPVCIVSTANADAASVQVFTGATLRTENNRTLISHNKCTFLPPN